jgi:hypothetical protein
MINKVKERRVEFRGTICIIFLGWYTLMLAGEFGVTAALFRAQTHVPNVGFIPRGSPCVDAAGANITRAVFILGETDCHLPCMDILTLPLRQGQSAIYIPSVGDPINTALYGSLTGIVLCLLTMPTLWHSIRHDSVLGIGFVMVLMFECPPGAFVLAVLSEIHVFWVPQVKYQVKSMAAVGAWFLEMEL